MLTCSRRGVVGTVIWFFDGCATDVDAWYWILVTTSDLGGRRLLVFYLGMFNYGPPSSTIL